MIATPGTRIASRDLVSWLAGLVAIDRRRASYARHQAIAAHWHVLPLAWLKEATDEAALAQFEAICARLQLKPRRGYRGGTKWELANMYRLNRLRQLEHDREWAEIGLGHNNRPQ